jgi:hypothetical protein
VRLLYGIALRCCPSLACGLAGSQARVRGIDCLRSRCRSYRDAGRASRVRRRFLEGGASVQFARVACVRSGVVVRELSVGREQGEGEGFERLRLDAWTSIYLTVQ